MWPTSFTNGNSVSGRVNLGKILYPNAPKYVRMMMLVNRSNFDSFDSGDGRLSGSSLGLFTPTIVQGAGFRNGKKPARDPRLKKRGDGLFFSGTPINAQNGSGPLDFLTGSPFSIERDRFEKAKKTGLNLKKTYDNMAFDISKDISVKDLMKKYLPKQKGKGLNVY